MHSLIKYKLSQMHKENVAVVTKSASLPLDVGDHRWVFYIQANSWL